MIIPKLKKVIILLENLGCLSTYLLQVLLSYVRIAQLQWCICDITAAPCAAAFALRMNRP